MRIAAASLALAALGAGAADALEFTLRTCAHDTVQVLSYDGTDLVRMVPYMSGYVPVRTEATVACATAYRFVRIMIGGEGTEVPQAQTFVCVNTIRPRTSAASG